MSVLLKAYSKNNLGDDLFIKIITDRYDDTFIIVNGEKNKSLSKIKNLKFKNCFIDKLLKKFVFKYSKLEVALSKKTTTTVLLGGSMFIQYDSIENVKNRNKMYSLLKNKYYILGTNFGPYFDKEYINEYKNIFKNAVDVCFREKYSYDLFKKDIPSVRYTKDIVFSLKHTENSIVDRKTVVISVIDCDKKIKKGYNENYKKLIHKIINYFDEMDYNIVLMSFCKHEGDEKIINEIIRENGKKNIEKYFYDGNIEEALEVIQKANIVVGTRFHANILGLIYKKCIIPIAYSDKTLNVLKDLGFSGVIFDIRKLNLNDFDKNMKDLDLNNVLNVDEAIQESNLHFTKLDEVLEVKKYE